MERSIKTNCGKDSGSLNCIDSSKNLSLSNTLTRKKLRWIHHNNVTNMEALLERFENVGNQKKYLLHAMGSFNTNLSF